MNSECLTPKLIAAMSMLLWILGCSSSQQQKSQQEQVQQNGQNQNNAQNAAVQTNNTQTAASGNTAQTPNNAAALNANSFPSNSASLNNAIDPETPPANTLSNVAVNAPANTVNPGIPPANTNSANLLKSNLANTPSAPAPAQLPARRLISKQVDLGPPHGTVQWVGYNYRKNDRQLDVQIVTDGKPLYKIFQETNRAHQPEIVVRFINTEIRHKIRRDIDASEFRSPVAYIRLRRDNIYRHTDVVLTLRETLQPRMIVKGSSIMLTFDISDRWFGPKGETNTPVAKVEIAPDASVMPAVDPNSDAPRTTPKATIATYIDDPGYDEFKSAPPEAAKTLVPVAGSPELLAAPEAVAPPLNSLPNNSVPVNGTSNIAPPKKPDAAPKKVAPKQAELQQYSSPYQAPQVQVPPPPVQQMPQPMMVPAQPMLAPPVVPIPQGVPGVVPQVQPFQPQAVPQTPETPKDNTGKAADKFEVREKSKYIEVRFSVAGVAQANANFAADIPSPVTNGTPIPMDPMSDLPVDGPTPANNVVPAAQNVAPTEIQGVEQNAVNGDQAVAAPKKAMKFDFRNATLGIVLRAISSESGLNFVMPPEVASKRVTVSLNSVPWDVALKAVLEANRMGMEEIGPKIIRIDTLKTFIEDRDTQEKAKQATAALVPTKVLVLRLSYALAEKVAPIVLEMFPKATDQGNLAQQRNYARFKVKADIRSNSLIIEATPMELAKLKALVARLDMPTPQVKISSRIVEILATAETGLGISWGSPFNLDGGRGLGFGSLPFPNNLTSNFAVDPAMNANPVGALSMKFGSINNMMALDLKIKMLEKRQEAESLQNQELMVEDNQEAKIEAGSVDYFEAPAQGLQGPTLTPVVYSTSLNVTPHITADGAVQMSLKITGDEPTTPQGKASAGKTTRSINTTMMRRSGDTAVIGGLYTTNRAKAVNGIPYLSSLPIIGALFRSTYTKDQRRDLLIMVTPTIVNTAAGNSDQDASGTEAAMGPLSAGAQGINPASSGNMAINSEMSSQTTNAPVQAQAQPQNQQQSSSSQQSASQQSQNQDDSDTSSVSLESDGE